MSMGVYSFFLEGFALIRTVTLIRIVNAAGCFIGSALSRLLRRPVVLGHPFAVSIESASICNLRCPDCARGSNLLTRASGLMPIALFSQVVEPMKECLMHAQLFFQGEPTLNPSLVPMVQLLSDARIYTSISTNGLLVSTDLAEQLVRAGLTRIIVSVDGITPQSYSRYRVGGDLALAFRAMERIDEAKRRMRRRYPIVEMQMLVFQYNLDELPRAKQLGRQHGANVVTFKTVQFSDPSHSSDRVPWGTRYSRYDRDALGQVRLKGNPNSHCAKPWLSLVVLHTGRVVPCCWDKDACFPMGSLAESSLPTIWRGAAYQWFRQQILSSKHCISICSQCPNRRMPLSYH